LKQNLFFEEKVQEIYFIFQAKSQAIFQCGVCKIIVSKDGKTLRVYHCFDQKNNFFWVFIF
jgi:hypothetical protein